VTGSVPEQRHLAGQARLAADADDGVELGVLRRRHLRDALAAFGHEDVAGAALGLAAAFADQLLAGIEDGLQEVGAGDGFDGLAGWEDGER
jgi:hypothetical protein